MSQTIDLSIELKFKLEGGKILGIFSPSFPGLYQECEKDLKDNVELFKIRARSYIKYLIEVRQRTDLLYLLFESVNNLQKVGIYTPSNAVIEDDVIYKALKPYIEDLCLIVKSGSNPTVVVTHITVDKWELDQS